MSSVRTRMAGCTSATTLVLLLAVGMVAGQASDALSVQSLDVDGGHVDLTVMWPLWGWLGCTFIDGENGREYDLGAVETRVMDGPTYGFQWDAPRAGSFRATIAVWNKRVERSDCARRHGGSPCTYCQRNGYHLEDEAARQWSSVDIPPPTLEDVRADGGGISFTVVSPPNLRFGERIVLGDRYGKILVDVTHDVQPKSEWRRNACFETVTGPGDYTLVAFYTDASGAKMGESRHHVTVSSE